MRNIKTCKNCLAYEKCEGYSFGVKCDNNALFIKNKRKRNKNIQDRIKKIPKLIDGNKILKELLDKSEEIISNPVRFEGVDIRTIKRIFEKYGIKNELPF